MAAPSRWRGLASISDCALDRRAYRSMMMMDVVMVPMVVPMVMPVMMIAFGLSKRRHESDARDQEARGNELLQYSELLWGDGGCWDRASDAVSDAIMGFARLTAPERMVVRTL